MPSTIRRNSEVGVLKGLPSIGRPAQTGEATGSWVLLLSMVLCLISHEALAQKPNLRLLEPIKAPPGQVVPTTEMCILPHVPAHDDPNSIRRHVLLGAARNASAQGNVDLAQRRYKEVLKEFPSDDATRYELVGLQMRWGKWRQAEKGIRTLVAADPRNDAYQETLADILIQQQRVEEATEVLERLYRREDLSTRVAIQLGRVLAWQKHFDRAEQVIARVASRQGSMPAELRVELAKYYLESQQPRSALNLANTLKQHGVDHLGIDVVLSRAHAELGNLDETRECIRRIDAHPNQDIRPRLDLADDFYRVDQDRLALAVYQQVLRRGHRDGVVIAKVVTTHVRLLDLPAAQAIIEEALADDSLLDGNSDLLAAYANYLVVVGRYAEAERVFRTLIHDGPPSVDVFNGYGHLWFSVGDYLRAAAEYRTSLTRGPDSRKTIRFLARSLVHSRQYDRALSLLEEAAHDADDGHSELLLPRIESMAAAGMHSEALAICAEALLRVTRHKERSSLLAEAGFAQLRLGNLTAAVKQFESVLQEYDPLSPQATYGMYLALQRLGESDQAEATVARFDDDVGDDLQRRMRLADLATDDCDGELAERILLPAREASPDNVFLLIRLGEAASLKDRPCGTCRDRNYFRQALELQPDNTRALLGLARSYARSRHACQSRGTYRTLLADFPMHRLANEELSRVTYWSCGPDVGMAAYTAARRRLADGRTTSEATPPNELSSDGYTPLTPATETLPFPMTGAASHRAQSTELEQRLLSLESCAKWHKPWRPRSALCYYRPLVLEDRNNEEGYFDLGQVFGMMDYTAAAAGRLRQLLDVNPCHTEALIALRRTHLERSPQVWSDVGVLDESGRDGLTEITRTRLSTYGRYPLGDENEYLYAGYAQEWLDGGFGSDLQANVALLGAHRRIWDYTTLFVDAEIADYTEGFSTRPQLLAGVQYRDCYDVVWTLTGFVDNVDDNRESINQDIFKRGLEVSAFIPCSWRWNLTATYRWSDYSDHNESHEALLASDYLLCYGCGRHQWRGIIDGYFSSFDEPTIRSSNPLDLAGTIHPYFAPDGFAYVNAGLEYKRWLSRYTFKYANQWWWSAYAGARVDSDGVGYGVGSLRCRRDHCNWLTTGIDASFVRSEVYDRTGVRAYLIVRFPSTI